MSQSTAEAAKSIVAIMKESCAPQTIVPVDEAQFQHLNLDEYQAFRTMLEAQGFSHLADVEILEISQSPTSVIAPTMIRVMVSKEGHITATYYQVRPNVVRCLKLLLRGLMNMRFIDAPRCFMNAMKTRHCSGFETEFDDGRFLVTSNAQSAGILSGPPTIESSFFPFGTPISFLLQTHQNRLNEILSNKDEPKPIVIHTLSEMLEMQKRQNDQKIAHRAASQWVTKGELQNMSSGNPELADAVFEEVQELLAQERSK
jgi:hypothetical protein